MAEKIIKNSARKTNEDTAEYEKYTPQYRILGVSPEEKNFEQVEQQGFDPGYLNVGNNEDLSWTKTLASDSKFKEEDLYLLLAKDQLIMTGSLIEIQKAVEQIFYQENNSKNLNFSVEDLTVLKKIKIKIGIFVE